MILVTGGTGRVGSHVVRALLERDARVRVLVRDPAAARGIFGDAVELAIGAWERPSSVRRALEGIDRVFLSGPDDRRRVGWESAAIDAAAELGVRQIVKLSSHVATPGALVAFWDWHGRIEEHLRRSGVPAVYLHAAFSMTNLLMSAPQVATEGRLYAPAGDARIAMIAVQDARDYLLTGPEAVTFAQVAEALSAAIGRPVEFVDVPDAAAAQAMVDAGLPEFVAQQIVTIFALARQGDAEHVSAATEALIGRPPTDVASFLRGCAPLFSSASSTAA
jgi:uncharacterized protein YbjT (DUF2867 family)